MNPENEAGRRAGILLAGAAYRIRTSLVRSESAEPWFWAIGIQEGSVIVYTVGIGPTKREKNDCIELAVPIPVEFRPW